MTALPRPFGLTAAIADNSGWVHLTRDGRSLCGRDATGWSPDHRGATCLRCVRSAKALARDLLYLIDPIYRDEPNDAHP